MRNLQAPEILLILLVVVLLFGAKRLPDTARGLGRSLRILKAETKGLRDDEKTDDETVVTAQQVPATPRPIESPVAPTVTHVTHTAPHTSDVSER
jgi:sec-independent protein translocase protein TatA